MNQPQTAIQTRLFEMQDLDYRDFQSRLMPGISKDQIIGVRTPELRRYAKEVFHSDLREEFLHSLPHFYYEENNLHGFLIEQIRDFDACLSAINDFLPYVDNWATCDMMRPKVFSKNLPALIKEIDVWLASKETYTLRFAIEMLMGFFLDAHFSPDHLEKAAQVKSEEYYVNMMIAWYFATALAKQYDAAVPYLQKGQLSPWVHQKTIQKAVESNRIPKGRKEYLKTLKLK